MKYRKPEQKIWGAAKVPLAESNKEGNLLNRMGTKIQDLDPVKSQKLPKKRRRGERNPSIEETYEDDEFAPLGCEFCFFSGNSPPMLPLLGNCSYRNVREQSLGGACGAALGFHDHHCIR
jgi:hypothetical protein